MFDTIKKSLVIFLMGPTASGKTNLAIALKQKQLNIEIISVDSALVYKGMDIGTAKPTLEELELAPHKLIDIKDPIEYYSAGDFFYDVNIEIENILKSKCVPLLVGGTMLYFKILLQGLFCLPKPDQRIRDDLQYEALRIGWMNMHKKLQDIDPLAMKMIHVNDHRRIIRALEVFYITGKTWTQLKFNSYKCLNYQVYSFAIAPSNRQLLHDRIEQRFYKMLEIGFVEEAKLLFNRYGWDVDMIKPILSCVGYRQMWEYLSGNIDYDTMISKGIYSTRKLAKNQLTWLKKWPNVHWLDSDNLFEAIDSIEKIIFFES